MPKDTTINLAEETSKTTNLQQKGMRDTADQQDWEQGWAASRAARQKGNVEAKADRQSQTLRRIPGAIKHFTPDPQIPYPADKAKASGNKVDLNFKGFKENPTQRDPRTFNRPQDLGRTVSAPPRLSKRPTAPGTTIDLRDLKPEQYYQNRIK